MTTITVANGKTYSGYCNGKVYGGYVYIGIPRGGKLMVTDAAGETYECNKNQVKIAVSDIVAGLPVSGISTVEQAMAAETAFDGVRHI